MGCTSFGEVWRPGTQHSAEQKLQGRDEAIRERTGNASSKTHTSSHENSSSNQDQVPCQHRKKTWRPTYRKHTLTQIDKYF